MTSSEFSQKLPPVVSVVTIARNDLAGLIRTVESLRAQSFDQWEQIVVDGGSSDGTRDWLSTQRDLTWMSEPDKGRYDAMNKGVAAATGSLVWFMNAGDTFHGNQALALAVGEWRRTSYRWAYGLSNVVADGATIGARGPIPFDRNRFLLGGVVIPHQAAVFARDLLDQTGPYDLSIGLAADQILMARAALISPPHVITAFLCDFDAGGAGSTRSARAHMRETTRARRASRIRVSRSYAMDRALSFGLLVGMLSARAGRRLLGRLEPRQD